MNEKKNVIVPRLKLEDFKWRADVVLCSSLVREICAPEFVLQFIVRDLKTRTIFLAFLLIRFRESVALDAYV